MVGNRIFPCLLAMLLAPLVGAQIYQRVDDKGNRLPVFTDRPQIFDGEFVEIEPLQINTVPGEIVEGGAAPADSASEDVTPVDAAAAAAAEREAAAAEQRAEQLEAQLNQLEEQRDQAAQDLERAEQALEEGKDPTEEDRVGNVGGGARLSDEYFRRVERLERQVDYARTRLDAIETRIRDLSRQR